MDPPVYSLWDKDELIEEIKRSWSALQRSGAELAAQQEQLQFWKHHASVLLQALESGDYDRERLKLWRMSMEMEEI